MGNTIREVFGQDVRGLVQIKTKELDAMFTIREPMDGIKIIKKEYEIYEDEK